MEKEHKISLSNNTNIKIVYSSSDNGEIYEIIFQDEMFNIIRCNNKPACIEYYKGNILYMYYYTTGNTIYKTISYYDNSTIKRTEITINKNTKHIIHYYNNGQKQDETYYRYKDQHRIEGPAYIEYNIDGSIIYEMWYLYGNPIDITNLNDFNEFLQINSAIILKKYKSIQPEEYTKYLKINATDLFN